MNAPLAPASTAMLQIVILASTLRSVIAGPANSIAYPVAPEAPIFSISAMMMSFDVTPVPSSPFTVTRMVFKRL
ncbi:hypothetical protein D3C80_1928440 [compost metagenome]